MPPATLRPRSIPELLDATFEVLRLHYVDIVSIAAVLWVPAILVMAVRSPLWQLLGLVLYMVANAATVGAVVILVSGTYLGQQTTIADALRGAFARLGALVGTALYQGVLVLLGLILLVIPAFIFFAWVFAMPMAVVLEGRSVSDAFSRSKELARGNVGRILLTLGVTWLITVVVSAAFGLVAGTLFAATGTLASSLASSLIRGIGSILVAPLFSAVATLLYYDLRMRKDGFDLEIMARELGTVTAPVPTA